MKINSQREIFLRKQNLDQKSSLSRERQGSRFDQKQAQTQAASQILDLIFGPAYGKLQMSRKSSAKRMHSIYKNKRTHLNDPSEKKYLKVSFQQETFYENNTSIKFIVVKKQTRIEIRSEIDPNTSWG